MKLSDLW